MFVQINISKIDKYDCILVTLQSLNFEFKNRFYYDKLWILL